MVCIKDIANVCSHFYTSYTHTQNIIQKPPLPPLPATTILLRKLYTPLFLNLYITQATACKNRVRMGIVAHFASKLKPIGGRHAALHLLCKIFINHRHYTHIVLQVNMLLKCALRIYVRANTQIYTS